MSTNFLLSHFLIVRIHKKENNVATFSADLIDYIYLVFSHINTLIQMDNHVNDNHPSRTINTPANSWGHHFGFRDWRGGVHHEWHANGVGVVNRERISNILRSNPIQWSDFTLVKNQISFTQIEIWNMEHSVAHFHRYIADDESRIEIFQKELDDEIERLIIWRVAPNRIPDSCTDPNERHYRRNCVLNRITASVFDSTCRLYELKIKVQHYHDELSKLNAILKETKDKLTDLVKCIMESDIDSDTYYTGPTY